MENLKNFIVYLLVPAAVIGLLFLMNRMPSRQPVAQKPVGPVSAAGESSFDFGAIHKNGGANIHYFSIVNKDTEPVTIDKIYTTCACVTAFFQAGFENDGPFSLPAYNFTPSVNIKLKAGGKAQLKVVFEPGGDGAPDNGRISQSVFVEVGDYAPVEFKVGAYLKP